MGLKSRAQIQKEYRERKKGNDPSFLEKERRREKACRIPAAELSVKKLKQRRQKSKVYSKMYRLNKQLQNAVEEEQPIPEDNQIQSEEISSTAEPQPSQQESLNPCW